MLFQIIGFDKGLGVAVIKPSPTVTDEVKWADSVVSQVSDSKLSTIGQRIDARFEHIINIIEATIVEDDGEIQ